MNCITMYKNEQIVIDIPITCDEVDIPDLPDFEFQ